MSFLATIKIPFVRKILHLSFVKKNEKKNFLLDFYCLKHLGVLLGVLLGKVGWGGVQKSPKIVKKSIFFELPKGYSQCLGGKRTAF